MRGGPLLRGSRRPHRGSENGGTQPTTYGAALSQTRIIVYQCLPWPGKGCPGLSRHAGRDFVAGIVAIRRTRGGLLPCPRRNARLTRESRSIAFTQEYPGSPLSMCLNCLESGHEPRNVIKQGSRSPPTFSEDAGLSALGIEAVREVRNLSELSKVEPTVSSELKATRFAEPPWSEGAIKHR